VRPIVSALLLVTAAICPAALRAAPQVTDPKAEARQLLLEAAQLIKDIPEDQQGSAASNIAGSLVRVGDLPDALATARLPRRAENQALATQTVAWQLAHEGNFTQALALAEAAANREEKNQGFDILAGLFAEKGDLKGALQMAHRIQNDPNRLVDALLRVASQLAQAGDHSAAREVLHDALNEAQEATKENLSAALNLLGVARGQVENGDKSAAFITMDQFSEIAHEYKQTEGANHLLEQLAGAQAQFGDLSGAEQTIEENPSGDSGFPLMMISEEQAKDGLMVDALETVERISSAGLKTAALREIAMIRGTHGTLNDSLEAINLISDPTHRAEALATLALEQAENDNPAASATLQAALNRAGEADPNSPDHVLGTIAVTRALLGDFIGAQQIVHETVNPEWRVWPLWNITMMLANQGHEREALDLAADQEAAEPKTYALLGTAQGILDRLEDEKKGSPKKQ
jgi:tetratricopeptide (TPR) repeat protein